jgi:hypothetical protein
MREPSIYTAWLPFAEEAAAEEPKRFEAAAGGLRAALRAAAAPGAPPGAWAAVLPWLEPLKRWAPAARTAGAGGGGARRSGRAAPGAHGGVGGGPPCLFPMRGPALHAGARHPPIHAPRAGPAPPLPRAPRPPRRLRSGRGRPPLWVARPRPRPAPAAPPPPPRPHPRRRRRRRSLVSTKTEFDRAAVAGVATDLWDVTLQSGADVEVQVRACEILAHVLRYYRRDKDLAGRLVLPWRPLFDAIRAQCAGEGLPELKGACTAAGGTGGGLPGSGSCLHRAFEPLGRPEFD